MPDKYTIQRRTASGLETVAELPALESGKIDLSWLPVVGSMGSAIIERGSNANGEYVRWADGTQVCWFCATGTYSCTAQTAAGFYDASGSGQKFTYPAEFSEIPSVMFSIGDFSDINGVTYFAGTATTGTKTESPYVVVLAVSSAVNNVVTIRYIAIGKWK